MDATAFTLEDLSSYNDKTHEECELSLFNEIARPKEDAPIPPTARELARERDQFYTKPEIAQKCMDWIHETVPGFEGTWLEPSAGAGAFLDIMPNPRIGVDLHPADRPEGATPVIEADFLTWKADGVVRPIITVGNPPFGRNASLALRFINHAMTVSDIICFILPLTFDKLVTQEKVDKHLELILNERLPDNSFIHHGQDYNVPCCFQIWRRIPNNGRRGKAERFLTHSHFEIVPDHKKADLAFQRVGARAGRLSKDGLEKSWKSHYFIKLKPGIDEDQFTRDIEAINWEKIRERTAGNPSIGKGELIAAYDEYLEKKGRPAIREKPRDLFG